MFELIIYALMLLCVMFIFSPLMILIVYGGMFIGSVMILILIYGIMGLPWYLGRLIVRRFRKQFHN
jgi:hypothetical protein